MERKTLNSMLKKLSKDGESILCPGCKKILDEKDAASIEMVKTKRGSVYVFHTKCMQKVWNSKI